MLLPAMLAAPSSFLNDFLEEKERIRYVIPAIIPAGGFCFTTTGEVEGWMSTVLILIDVCPEG
jgi:hypothetical protein